MAAEAETGRSRSQSPVRTILASDVDPDQIQSALRQHSQRVMQLERERVCIAVSLFKYLFNMQIVLTIRHLISKLCL